MEPSFSSKPEIILNDHEAGLGYSRSYDMILGRQEKYNYVVRQLLEREGGRGNNSFEAENRDC